MSWRETILSFVLCVTIGAVVAHDEGCLQRPFMGQAIHALALGGALWIPGATLIFLFRAARHPEGCCQRCGYDLRGAAHERCPECGTPTADPGRPTTDN